MLSATVTGTQTPVTTSRKLRNAWTGATAVRPYSAAVRRCRRCGGSSPRSRRSPRTDHGRIGRDVRRLPASARPRRNAGPAPPGSPRTRRHSSRHRAIRSSPRTSSTRSSRPPRGGSRPASCGRAWPARTGLLAVCRVALGQVDHDDAVLVPDHDVLGHRREQVEGRPSTRKPRPSSSRTGSRLARSASGRFSSPIGSSSPGRVLVRSPAEHCPPRGAPARCGRTGPGGGRVPAQAGRVDVPPSPSTGHDRRSARETPRAVRTSAHRVLEMPGVVAHPAAEGLHAGETVTWPVAPRSPGQATSESIAATKSRLTWRQASSVMVRRQ